MPAILLARLLPDHGVELLAEGVVRDLVGRQPVLHLERGVACMQDAECICKFQDTEWYTIKYRVRNTNETCTDIQTNATVDWTHSQRVRACI